MPPRAAGADLVTGACVTGVAADGRTGEVTYRQGDVERTVAASYVLAGVAPAVLDRLRGRKAAVPGPEGTQMKINMVLDRLPHTRCTALHARVAQTLEAHGDPALTPRIAHHYLASGDQPKALMTMPTPNESGTGRTENSGSR